jgi:hypothetical protein
VSHLTADGCGNVEWKWDERSSDLNAVKAKYENGQIVLTEPVDWPEGTDVVVEPLPQETTGIPDDQWPTDPEGIARLLARMDQVQSFWLSPEDHAEWEAALQAQKEFEKSIFHEHAEKLRRTWE